MPSQLLDSLIKQVDLLSPNQKLQLIAHMAGELCQRTYPQNRPRRKWRELCGIVDYPCLGEDAQVWISQSREKNDAERSHNKG